MRRFVIPLLAAVFALGSVFALSCGSSAKDEPTASPTVRDTVAAKTVAATPAATKSPASVSTPGKPTATSADDEPTRHSGLLKLCLGVTDERWRQVCAATAGKDLSMCSDMPVSSANGKVGWQALCGFSVAAATKDTAICDNIQTVAPGYDPAIMNLGEWGSDCYMYVAVSAKDASLCSRTQSAPGCEHNVAVAKGEVALDQCLVTDTDCVFAYAYQHQSSQACDRLAGGAMGQTFQTACQAMLSGDKAHCDPLKSVGVNEWAACVTWALYGQAHPSDGSFEFSACGDDEGCLSMALHEMANYIAGQ